MIKELDRIVLTTAIPNEALEPGDVGTVVHAYGDGEPFEVELTTLYCGTAVVAICCDGLLRPLAVQVPLEARHVEAQRLTRTSPTPSH